MIYSCNKILFHLGIPKTGTSALQNALFSAAGDDRKGFCYPSIFRNGGIAHHGLAQLLIGSGPADLDQIIEKIVTDPEINKSEGTVVISSESLMMLLGKNDSWMCRYLKQGLSRHFDLSYIAIIREITSFLEAMFLQSGRFGKLKGSFQEYILSRERWIENLFIGISNLLRDVDSSLSVEYYCQGFDTVTYFEKVLSLGSGSLSGELSKQRPTFRRSAKQETVLFFASDLSREFGVSLDRSKLLSIFERFDLFSDDTWSFTLYNKQRKEALHEKILSMAKKVGFYDYVEKFADLSENQLPVIEIDKSLITKADRRRLLEAWNDFHSI